MRRVALLGAIAAGCGVDQTGRDVCDEGQCAAGTLTFGVRVESQIRSSVGAVAIIPDEPPWFAGTHDSLASISGLSLEGDASGDEDPFIARTGVRGLEPLAVNLLGGYPAPVVGIVPDSEDGALLFAIGEQLDARLRLEASWVDRDGDLDELGHYRPFLRQPIAFIDAAGAFGGAAATSDARGWPIVAVSGTRIAIVEEGEEEVHEGARAMVLRLGQGLRPEILLDLPGIDIADVDADGDLVAIAGSYTGAPTPPDGSAPWPACTDPDPCGFIAAIDLPTGLVRWVQAIHAPGGAAVHVVGTDAAVVVGMASAAGAPTDPALGTGAIPAYLVSLTAAGSSGQPELLDQTILADTGAVVSGRDLDVADDGGVVVAFGYRGSVLVGSDPPSYNGEPDTYAGVIAELGTDLNWQWRLFVQMQSVDMRTVAVKGDQVAFGGVYRGAFSLLNPLEVTLPEPAEVDNGFVLEVHR